MGLDIRWPIGLMFSLVGLLMTAYGFVTRNDAEVYRRSLGININLIWGVLLLVFGILMLFLAARGRDGGGPPGPYNQAALTSIQLNQSVNLPASYQALLQNFTQTSTGATTSLSYPIKRSFKRVGITYSFDDSSVQTFSTASTDYFQALAFRGISGPNALNGIITSKIIPNLSYNKIDNPQRPHSGQSVYFATEFAGLGGNVRYIKPVAEYKKFIPVNKGRNTLGVRVLGSWISGYGGQVAPPFDRFYMGGDTDISRFDIRAISPVAFFPSAITVPLQNPDGTTVPLDPSNPRRGAYGITIPVEQIIFPGGDTNLVNNIEYRIPIIGPVTVAAFVDTGFDLISNQSQLRIAGTQF